MSKCIEWRGAKSKNGYGNTTYQGKSESTHRLAWINVYGPIPTGMHVLHKCDNKSCINVNHLFLGTQLDNMKDKVSKGRQSYGEYHGRAKLTEKEVEQIRIKYAGGGYTQRELAKKYDISQTNISNIINYKRWHL